MGLKPFHDSFRRILKHPTFTVFSLDELVGRVVVGDTHVGTIPHQASFGTQGQVAEQHYLRQGTGVFKVGARRLTCLTQKLI